MKTLFANNGNNNFASFNLDVLTSEELTSVKGGYGPRDIDIFLPPIANPKATTATTQNK